MRYYLTNCNNISSLRFKSKKLHKNDKKSLKYILHLSYHGIAWGREELNQVS